MESKNKTESRTELIAIPMLIRIRHVDVYCTVLQICIHITSICCVCMSYSNKCFFAIIWFNAAAADDCIHLKSGGRREWESFLWMQFCDCDCHWDCVCMFGSHNLYARERVRENIFHIFIYSISLTSQVIGFRLRCFFLWLSLALEMQGMSEGIL